MEQQGGANAHGRTGHCRNDRFFKCGQRPHEMKHRRVHCGRWLVQKVANVIAGTENRFMTLDDQHACGGVGLCLVNGLCHGGVHVTRDGILFVQTVEGEGHHTCVEVGQDVRHAVASFRKLNGMNVSWCQAHEPRFGCGQRGRSSRALLALHRSQRV